MVKLLKGKGKVAVMGILGMKNMEAGFRGFQDAIKPYPGIEYLGKYDDKANVETAARLASDLIAAHPDMVFFDSKFTHCVGFAARSCIASPHLTKTTHKDSNGVFNWFILCSKSLPSWDLTN